MFHLVLNFIASVSESAFFQLTLEPHRNKTTHIQSFIKEEISVIHQQVDKFEEQWRVCIFYRT